MENPRQIKLGISIGDINGISPEIILKTFDSTLTKGLFIPIIYGSAKHLNKVNAQLKSKDWKYQRIKHPDEAVENQIYIVECLKGDFFELEVGKATKLAGELAFEALERATDDLKTGAIDGLVTCPINKDTIQGKDFNFPGHTEYLTNRLEVKESLMFMVSERLRVGVVTGHIPLEKVKQQLTDKRIRTKLDLMLESLKVDFGIQKPKIAVLGLNPHAGENGLLGTEEINIISPIIEAYRKTGNLVFGPFPADGFFAARSYERYDAVLAMYHDQGLAPFKIISFGEGVNFTAGLPAVRTSPDHGTAYDIAGQGTADASSLLNAIFLALDVIKTRRSTHEYTVNQLDTAAIRKKIVGRYSK